MRWYIIFGIIHALCFGGFYLNHVTVISVRVKIPKEEQGWQNGVRAMGFLVTTCAGIAQAV